MQRIFVILMPLTAWLLLCAAEVHGASLQGRWGPEASTSEKKVGAPQSELDGYSDMYRAWESTGPYAETQGVYRETLKTQPVCYDPRKPERMPWYVEREYETRTVVVADAAVSAGAHFHYGNGISFWTDFTTRTQWTVDYTCGVSLTWEAPAIAVDYAVLCAPGTTLTVSIIWDGNWNPSNGPDIYYLRSVPQMPSCANGLRGFFQIIDSGTCTGKDGNNRKKGLGHHWGLRFYATKSEVVDITPTYTECFYP